ncbi:MAG: hypothetical protein WBG10_09465, partial [Pseudolabrys sp.]
SGTLEATGSGGLIVNSDVSNSGLIWADGGDITFHGAVTGNGGALISGAATLEFAAASSVSVTFGDNFGTLVLDNPSVYTGHIFGFTGTSPQNSDVIDLKGITFDAATSWTYVDNAGSNTGGALTISETINGAANAVDTINFANGDYSTANFIVTSDGSGGTLVVDPPPQSTLTAGTGNNNADTLIGGSSTFVFKSILDSQPGAGHFDTITDFTHNSNHIDLTAIAGATNVQGAVTAANTVDANSISWFVDNAHKETVLFVNTTAMANHVDMEIHLAGTNINLGGSDILHHT